MNDERLRAVYERILAQSRPSGDDPTPEQMLALVEGRGSDAERLRTLERVMRSEESRRDFELLRAAAAASRPPRRGVNRMLAAAAVVLVVAGASAVTWRELRLDGASDNVMRGGEPTVVLAAPNDSPAVSGPLVFVWRPVAGATSYEVELVEASGALVKMDTVRDTTWTPPASVHLTPGTEYRWWVRATLTDGTTVEAPPRRLVLSP
jgi:hypothetical protein